MWYAVEKSHNTSSLESSSQEEEESRVSVRDSISWCFIFKKLLIFIVAWICIILLVIICILIIIIILCYNGTPKKLLSIAQQLFESN